MHPDEAVLLAPAAGVGEEVVAGGVEGAPVRHAERLLVVAGAEGAPLAAVGAEPPHRAVHQVDGVDVAIAVRGQSKHEAAGVRNLPRLAVGFDDVELAGLAPAVDAAVGRCTDSLGVVEPLGESLDLGERDDRFHADPPWSVPAKDAENCCGPARCPCEGGDPGAAGGLLG